VAAKWVLEVYCILNFHFYLLYCYTELTQAHAGYKVPS